MTRGMNKFMKQDLVVRIRIDEPIRSWNVDRIVDQVVIGMGTLYMVDGGTALVLIGEDDFLAFIYWIDLSSVWQRPFDPLCLGKIPDSVIPEEWDKTLVACSLVFIWNPFPYGCNGIVSQLVSPNLSSQSLDLPEGREEWAAEPSGCDC